MTEMLLKGAIKALKGIVDVLEHILHVSRESAINDDETVSDNETHISQTPDRDIEEGIVAETENVYKAESSATQPAKRGRYY